MFIYHSPVEHWRKARISIRWKLLIDRIVRFCLCFNLSFLLVIPAQCNTVQYVQTNDQHISGGTFQSGASDVNACQTLCTNDPQCAGVDFVPLSGSCFTLPQSISLIPLTDDTGVQHYRKTRRGCTSGGTCECLVVSYTHFLNKRNAELETD